MKHLLATGAGALLLCASGAALADRHAGFEIEPMLTYERGRGDNNEIDGLGVGGKLGFHLFNSLTIGADGRYSAPKFEGEAGTVDFSASARQWNVGPYIGLQLPTTFSPRVWATYVMAGELDPERDAGVNAFMRDARGFRLGAGIRVGWASVNLEYQDIQYNTTRLGFDGTTFPTSFDSDLGYDSWILSVSFPFHL
jgi:hypothetical protein